MADKHTTIMFSLRELIRILHCSTIAAHYDTQAVLEVSRAMVR